MFCGKCGIQVNENERFCPRCGNAMHGGTQGVSSVVEPGKKKAPKMIGLVVALALIAVVIVVATLCISLSGGYKGAVKSYMKTFRKGDLEKRRDLMYPKEVWAGRYEEWYDMTTQEYAEILEIEEKAEKVFWEELEKEGKVKFTYEIKKAESLDNLDDLQNELGQVFYDYDEDDIDLDTLRDYMDEHYGDYDFDADKIKKAYAVEVDFELEVDGDEAVDASNTFIAYKYKGKWYVLGGINFINLVNTLDPEDYEDAIEEFHDAYEDAGKALSEIRLGRT